MSFHFLAFSLEPGRVVIEKRVAGASLKRKKKKKSTAFLICGPRRLNRKKLQQLKRGEILEGKKVDSQKGDSQFCLPIPMDNIVHELYMCDADSKQLS